MPHFTIPPPCPETLLVPFLGALPAAAVAPTPPTALLPRLSPILRQRVQFLSSSSEDPWLPLLCWDSTKASKLEQTVRNERLEPHPVSGEVEVDWDGEVNVTYKRVDEETLHTLLALRELDLSFKLLWCTGDELGGGDGWRIAEVIPLADAPQNETWKSSIADAESSYAAVVSATAQHHAGTNALSPINGSSAHNSASFDDDDDVDYWASYDRTPARTPQPKATASPAPQVHNSHYEREEHPGDEDSYFAQYASVQPAMDSHDPEEAQANGDVESTLNGHAKTYNAAVVPTQDPESSSPKIQWPSVHGRTLSGNIFEYYDDDDEHISRPLVQPRPASRTPSSGSDTVARLEERAAAASASSELAAGELAIKQHIGTTLKSMYRLSRAVGIDRKEFERLVQTELDCLGLMDEDDG